MRKYIDTHAWRCSVLLLALLLGACSEHKEKVSPYREGDIVQWKLTPELIVKATLGKRRQHIPDQFDTEFYHPDKECYIGQFPIDYQPRPFDTLPATDIEQFPRSPCMGGIEFNLMLNGKTGLATDKSRYSDTPMDSSYQVKVVVDVYRFNELRTNTWQRFKGQLETELDATSKTTRDGMDCYKFRGDFTREKCFGRSDNKRVSGFELYVPSDPGKPLRASSSELVDGNLNIEWLTAQKNRTQAKAIDAAIWRLLAAWNVVPKNYKLPATENPYKTGNTVVWKLAPRLIVKARVGKVQFAADQPSRPRHYLGQFATDYQPQKLAVLKTDAIETLTLEDSLYFNLLLHGARQAPATGWYSYKVPNQVQVLVHGIHNFKAADVYAPSQHMSYLLGMDNFIVDQHSRFEPFGLSCYRIRKQYDHLDCVAKTGNPQHPEIFLQVMDDPDFPNQLNVKAYSISTAYGGVKIMWQANAESLKDWKAIDADIWRLLAAWNGYVPQLDPKRTFLAGDDQPEH